MDVTAEAPFPNDLGSFDTDVVLPKKQPAGKGKKAGLPANADLTEAQINDIWDMVRDDMPNNWVIWDHIRDVDSDGHLKYETEGLTVKEAALLFTNGD